MLYPNAVSNESAKPNKNKRGKINLKNLLAWSLERAVNTVGDTIITKNNEYLYFYNIKKI